MNGLVSPRASGQQVGNVSNPQCALGTHPAPCCVFNRHPPSWLTTQQCVLTLLADTSQCQDLLGKHNDHLKLNGGLSLSPDLGEIMWFCRKKKKKDSHWGYLCTSHFVLYQLHFCTSQSRWVTLQSQANHVHLPHPLRRLVSHPGCQPDGDPNSSGFHGLRDRRAAWQAPCWLIRSLPGRVTRYFPSPVTGEGRSHSHT